MIGGMSQDMAGSSQESLGGSHERKFVPLPRDFIVNNGWIKIHRKITDWEWYSDHAVYRVFSHLLFTVNHQDKKWQGKVIKSGQKITSLAHLASDIGLSVQSVRTALKKLESTGEITSEKNNKYSLITIQNWKSYQEKNIPINTQVNTPLSRHNNNQSTTNKKLKKIRSKELTSTTDVGNEINHLIGLFKPLNPSIEKMFGRQPQREACERILKNFGIERAKNALLFAEKCRDDRYCPVITTPIQLEDKWGALEIYARKAKKDINKNKIVTI